MKNLKVGDKVWCWDPACAPVIGAITEMNPLGMAEAYRCHLENTSLAPDRIWCEFRVFKRPEDRDCLKSEMLDHADFIVRHAEGLTND